ncbi:MAG: Co2+/Mg2+ efflux protein ApaG [Deltaproteobacteria bacterium]|nr:Co2+/Mg2+ efflux protein ApaG [Deltaproteobacteria bacterium]
MNTDLEGSEAVTQGIRVVVEPQYFAERSVPEQGLWFFLYTVTISNEGLEKAKLVTRHWIITDGDGSQEEVKGPGVVGETPVLAPGESFSYTSGCPLSHPFGSMRGTYQMVAESGHSFDAEIATFELVGPYTVH